MRTVLLCWLMCWVSASCWAVSLSVPMAIKGYAGIGDEFVTVKSSVNKIVDPTVIERFRHFQWSVLGHDEPDSPLYYYTYVIQNGFRAGVNIHFLAREFTTSPASDLIQQLTVIPEGKVLYFSFVSDAQPQIVLSPIQIGIMAAGAGRSQTRDLGHVLVSYPPDGPCMVIENRIANSN